MPGAFAHLTLVSLARETKRLAAVPGFPRQAIVILQRHLAFCELGAVSPDYPYLALIGDHAHWADKMHYEGTGDIVRAAVKRLRPMNGVARDRCLAWLLGYTAHLTMDATVHPVIELKVGEFATHQREHRVCEMNQDAYIFDRLDLGGIDLAEHLDSGISACQHSTNPDLLDESVSGLWTAILGDVHPKEAGRNPPDPSLWHRSFKFLVDKIADNGSWLVPLSRHTIGDPGVFYPKRADVDMNFIHNLPVPGKRVMNYGEIFDQALANVVERWSAVAQGVLYGDEDHVASMGNWNLDTGRDAEGQLVFWRVA